jgi:hypothetical protein
MRDPIRIEVNGEPFTDHPEFASLKAASDWIEARDWGDQLEPGVDRDIAVFGGPTPEEAHEAFAKLTTDRWLENQDLTNLIGHELSDDERSGFLQFFEGYGRLPEGTLSPDYRAGRVYAERLCYAQGALSSHFYANGVGDGESPYAQFSAAWEVWADGYNDEGSIHRG